ncbi:hypothetical protein SO694_00008570 [Aureococcus anophagefferens]|uniref:VDE lipocalin domain-containing protein n=1 Tax=Aureococcus anophagefferens TaxID=44056 RepID=A0ABR1GEG8_AURAN
MTCTAKCLGDNACITGCFAKYGNAPMNDLLECSIEKNSCIKVAILPTGPDSATEAPAPPLVPVANFDQKTLEGTWYKVMGWNDRYDCFDCQKNFRSAPGALLGDGVAAPRARARTEGHMFGLTFWENWSVIGENAKDEPEFKFIHYSGKTSQNTYEGAFLSPTHVEGVVSKWLVSEGDAVEACDLVAHLDADDVYDGSDLTGRVTMLLETHDDGVVAELLVNEGEQRPPGGGADRAHRRGRAGVDALKAAYRDCPDGADADAVASQLGARLMARRRPPRR